MADPYTSRLTTAHILDLSMVPLRENAFKQNVNGIELN